MFRATIFAWMLVCVSTGVVGAPPAQDWAKTISGKGNSDAYLPAAPSGTRTQPLAVDSVGNFVVAGHSYNGTDDESMIVKFSASGVEIWRAFVREPSKVVIAPHAVAIDAADNVYVVANVVESGRSRMMTVKYDSAGGEQWRRILSPQFEQEKSFGLAIELDSQGNPHVFGQHTGYLDRDGYIAVKYSADGNLLWRAKVTKPTEAMYLFSGKVTPSGEVVLGGAGVLAKLSSAGTEVWRTSINQLARQIAVDASGQIYLLFANPLVASTPVGVVKVAANGVEQWQRVLGSELGSNEYSFRIAVGGDGKPVVAGALRISGENRFFRAKLDQDGNELWRNSTADTAGGASNALALGTDDSIYVGGTMYWPQRHVVEKLSPAGVTLWQASALIDASQSSADSPGDALVVRADGGAVLAWNKSFVQVSQSPLYQKDIGGMVVTSGGSPVIEWRTGTRDELSTLLGMPDVDANGNVYLSGIFSMSSSGYRDGAFVARVNADGSSGWISASDAQANRLTSTTSTQIDADGGVVHAGTTWKGTLGSEFIIRKISADGQAVWQSAVSGLDSQPQSVSGCAPAGKFLLRTHSLLAQFTSAGQEVWRSAAAGNLANDGLCGAVFAGSISNPDLYDLSVTRIGASGALTWQRTLDIGDSRDDLGEKAAFGPSGVTFAAGRRTKSNGFYEVFLVQFNLSGNEAWRRFVSSGTQSDTLAHLLVDTTGNSYLLVDGPNGVYLVKFTSSGFQEWSRMIDLTEGGYTAGNGLAIDQAGNIYASGAADKPAGIKGFWLSKVTPAGDVSWHLQGNVAAGDMEGAKVKVLADGKLLLQGSYLIPGGPRIGMVARYRQFLSAPRDVRVVASDAKAFVYFTSPESDAGFPISGYSVSCAPGIAPVSGGASPIVVGGLQNGTEYSCSVTASDSRGNAAISAAVNVTPSADAPVVILDAYSIKTHGAGGIRKVRLRVEQGFTVTNSVEPRMESDYHLLELAFDRPILSVGTAIARDEGGNALGQATPTISNGNVLVRLNGIPDGSRARVTIQGLNSTHTQELYLGFLVGDVTSSGRVTAADVVSAKANRTRPVDNVNAVMDINRDGVIDNLDVGIIRSRAGSVVR